MAPKEAVEKALRAYWHHWRAWARVAPDGSLHETGEILAAATGVPGPFLNRVIVFGAPRDADGALTDAIAVMDTKGVPFIVEVFPGAEEMRAVAERTGLKETKGGPFMVHPEPEAVGQTPPGDIAIARATGAKDLDDWAVALAGGFAGPVDFTRLMAWPGVLEDKSMGAFVGRASGEPVATSLANFEGDATGIYNVSTVERLRRRGIGAAITAAAMRAGADAGCRIAYLQSSDLGLGMYTKMGFEPVLRSTVYVRPKLDA